MLNVNLRLLTTAAIAFTSLFVLFHWNKGTSLSCKISLDQSREVSSLQPQKRRNVALATAFPFHHDIMLGVGWTLQRVMGDNGDLTLYADTPLSWNFQNVMDKLGLYHGKIKSLDQLLKDVNSHPLGGGIDMIVFGTCEIDMRHYHKELLAAWDARDEDHKFELVCMVHNSRDYPWQESIPDWSRRNAIRILTISEHVAKIFRYAFQVRAESNDTAMSSSGYEDVPIDVHVQILNLPDLPDLSPTRTLSNAVIQGIFDPNRRDYFRIFEELRLAIHENPQLWGYKPLGNGPSFVPDNNAPLPPFHLHLAGSGARDIPIELKEVVKAYSDLDYAGFYDVMGGMDVCIPAFSSGGDAYFSQQASSTVGMCLEVNVPMIVTKRIRQHYTYIDDERVVITRPAVMTEIQTIKAFRLGDASAVLASDPSKSGVTIGSNPWSRQAIEDMMKRGWVRPKSGFNVVKERIWGQNYEVAWRILRDLSDGQGRPAVIPPVFT